MNKRIGIEPFFKTYFANKDVVPEEVKKSILFDGTMSEVTIVILPDAIRWAREKNVPECERCENFIRRPADKLGLECTITGSEWVELCQEHGQDPDSLLAEAA